MAFQRVTQRKLPDGSVRTVFPFHISLEGLENQLLCRDDEDYDQLEKSFYLAAFQCNALVIIAIAMSNHGHVAILAPSMNAALEVGETLKRRVSQYISWKYNQRNTLSRSSVSVQLLDSDWYVRNALAYIVRNALDTGSRVEDYRWSGYRGMFVQGKCPPGSQLVGLLSRREREALFRTHCSLADVPWQVNREGQVEPASACDYQYLESAFGNDQAFFLKTIGSLNAAEMTQKLVLNTRNKKTDAEMDAVIRQLAERWFQQVPGGTLTPERKARLVPYLYRCYRTGVPQLARCLQLSREQVQALLPKRRR